MRISDWSSDVCSSDLRTHPETGRKALYVNVAHTLRFKDMTEEESAPLLSYLFQHQVRPEQIGRASCRERVCQYVWITVHAVSLIKKENDIIMRRLMLKTKKSRSDKKQKIHNEQ